MSRKSPKFRVVHAAATAPPKPPTTELGNESGQLGAMSWATFFGGDSIERVAELQWPNSVFTYAYMLNDAQLNSLYLGTVYPIMRYRYYLEPNGARPEIVERISRNYNLPIGSDPAEPYNRRRGARRFSFQEHIQNALRMLYYGHMYFEQVGDIDMDPITRVLVWNLRKLALRPNRTLTEINVDRDGSLASIRQATGPQAPPIPVNRLVAYIWDREGADWTGRSLLRPVYRNHLVKDRILRVGAINIERAGGIPYVEAPEGASGDQIRELDYLARRFRVGEGAGAALPHGAQLKFANAAGGDGAVNYIHLQNEEMARSWLQMFQTMGQQSSAGLSTGSAVSSLIDYFALGQEFVAQRFCDIFNEHMIEDDVDWNEGPEEEYTPLLAFSSAEAPDPEEGLRAAAGEDDGLDIEPSGEVAAQLGLRATRRPRRAPARTAAGADTASPVMLPPRQLRRNPYDHEVRAAVNFANLDSQYASALGLMVMEVRQLQQYQIDQLHDAIVDAAGDLDALSEISTDALHADVIAARLRTVSDLAVTEAVSEASRQGVTVPRPDPATLASALLDRAEAVDALLARNLAQTASRNAIRLTGGGLSPAEVADMTRSYLRGLTGTYLNDVLGGAVQQAQNAGRKLVFNRDGQEGRVYSSELLDSNTCTACVGIDGTEYVDMETAERDYPTGGYHACEGRERCRGTLVKVYATEAEATL